MSDLFEKMRQTASEKTEEVETNEPVQPAN
jgi:hypothetical protein